jgi:stage II sporulation protein P
MIKKAISRVIIGLIAIAIGWFPQSTSTQELDFFDLFNMSERIDGSYFTMIDQADGSVLLKTARILKVGTEFIDSRNRLYRVVSIKEDTAVAEWIEENSPAATGAGDMPAGLKLTVQAEEGQAPIVGIYHSHGAESYVPSDGTASIVDGGGILDVGVRFSEALEQEGIETVHEKETHVPHDAGAYMRSRGTAEKLLTEDEVDLKIDVHRDATPAETYETEVRGEQVTHILLVVGAQNQNAANNKQLAGDLKAVADEHYPGLVKGILKAPGSYNQDLAPNSILIEVGAHENRKEDAKQAVTMFADVVDIYLTGEAAPEQQAQQSGIALNRTLIVLIVVAAAAVIYLYISAGSLPEMKRKSTLFFKREFADLRSGWEKMKRKDNE